MRVDLKRIAIRGLMSLRDVEIEPGPITVLIGPNGAGKSNLLTAFEILARLRAGTFHHFLAERGPASALVHYGPKVTREIDIDLDFSRGDAQASYHARLYHAPGTDSFLFADGSTGWHDPSDPSVASSVMASLEPEWIRPPPGHARPSSAELDARLAGISHFHFHDTSSRASLRLAAREADARALHADGGNLAPFLLTLAESAPGSSAHNAWRRINHLVGRVAPAIKALAPARVGRDSVRLDWIDDRGELFGPARLSDGTLRAIALITALAQPAETRPGFISIDEPELGLHPAALSVLAGLVRAIAPTSQVLLATQSPALLDHFTADEVLVTERHDGESRFRRLDVASLQAWLDEYRLSELYDRNILGGRP